MDRPPGLGAIVDHDRELHHIVQRLREEHPSISTEVIVATVHQAYEDLGAGTVQNFRIVLTERRARRLLLTVAREPGAVSAPDPGPQPEPTAISAREDPLRLRVS